MHPMRAAKVSEQPRPDRSRRGPVVVELIGGFSLTGSAGPVLLPSAQRRLVAYLALARRPTARQQLASTLWPDLVDQRARGALRSALYRLHQLVPGELLEGLGDRVQMAASVSCDVRHVLDWSDVVLHSEPPGADGYPVGFGELLPGWDDEWVVLERERFRQRVLHAYEALAAHLVAAGRHADAVEVALAAVGMDPFRESANRTLIAAHLAEGNTAEALRHYNLFAHRLRTELGLDPSLAITALVTDHVRRAGARQRGGSRVKAKVLDVPPVAGSRPAVTPASRIV